MAFDTVNHNHLLCKLNKNFIISGKALRWLESYYLVGYTFSAVIINDNQSNRMPVLSGVFQRSILGPLLFTVYVNKLNTGTFGEGFGVPIHSYFSLSFVVPLTILSIV